MIKPLRILIVWSFVAWCVISLFSIISQHKMIWTPPAIILFPWLIATIGLQEKRWHETISYPLIIITTLGAFIGGIYV